MTYMHVPSLLCLAGRRACVEAVLRLHGTAPGRDSLVACTIRYRALTEPNYQLRDNIDSFWLTYGRCWINGVSDPITILHYLRHSLDSRDIGRNLCWFISQSLFCRLPQSTIVSAVTEISRELTLQGAAVNAKAMSEALYAYPGDAIATVLFNLGADIVEALSVAQDDVERVQLLAGLGSVGELRVEMQSLLVDAPERCPAYAALRAACRGGQVPTVQFVLSNYDAVADYKCVQVAAERGHVDVVDVLLRTFTALEIQRGRWQWWVGVADIPTAELLLSHGVQTDLCLTACRLEVDLMRFLLEHGVSARDGAPIWAACTPAQIDVLVDHGESVDAVWGFDRCPLIVLAVRKGRHEVLRHLIRLGANVNAADRDGITPLIAAAIASSHVDVSILLMAGAIVDAQDCTGRTALHQAVFINNLDTVSLLLSFGASVTVRTRTGETALDIAVKNGTQQAQSLLGLRALDECVVL